MKKSYLGFILLPVIIFFWKTLFYGLIPVPADALVGLYHPFRDYYAVNFPNGVPFKNYILTDPVLQQYPWKWLVINGWKEIFMEVFKGQGLPWQGRALSYIRDNPYNFSGTPLLANIQAGTFYPLNLIFIFINDFSLAWTIFIIIQPILATLFMSWWLKNHGIRQAAAIFGGLIWAFSSFNMVWLEWGNIGHSGLYLPLALLAVDKLKVKSEKLKVQWKWHLLLQFSLVSSLFAGHFQVTFYLLAAIGLYWFIHLGISKKSVCLFTVHCLLFTFFTSSQWFPSLKFALQSNRSVEQADVLTHEGFFIRPRQLIQMITPDFFGNPSTLNYRGAWNYAEQIIYIGIIPLLFVLLGVLIKIKNSQENDVDSISYSIPNLHGFCWSLIIAGLLLAVKNPIAEIPYRLNIPVWQDLQPTRLSYLITFGLATLSALGFNQFIKNPRKLTSKVIAIAIAFSILLFALLVISSKFSPEDKLISQRNLISPVVVLMLFSIAAGGSMILKKIDILNNRNLSLFLASCFLLLVILDLFHFGWKFTPFSAKEYLYPATPAIKFLQENMGINDRYMTLDRRLLPPNANIMYKLKSIEGYDPIYSRNYAGKIAEMENGDEIIPNYGRIIRPTNFNSPVARELNIKYVLSLKDIKDPNLEKVFQEGETRIYKLTGK